jgi:lipopolysaccharide export system permease protein
MDAITRYVTSDILKTFLVAVIGTTLIMTFGGGVQEGMRKGLPPLLALEIMPYILPEMLRYTLPGCLLYAVCTVFGRLAANNELTAIKAMGIHPWNVVWPALFIGFVLSLASFWMYDLCASWARPSLRRTVVESIREIAYGVLRTERSYHGDSFAITVKGVRDETLLQPVIVLEGNENRPAVTMTAYEAEILSDHTNHAIRLVCRNGQVDVAGNGTLWFSDAFEQSIPYEKSPQLSLDDAPPAAVPMSNIQQQIRRKRSKLKQLARAGQAEPEAEKKKKLRRDHANLQKNLARLEAETQRRLANGFTCLCFALVGCSVAIWRKQGDGVSIFFVCFMPILLVYYPLLVLSEKLATSGQWPVMIMWLGNAVLCVAGLALLQRAVRQ